VSQPTKIHPNYHASHKKQEERTTSAVRTIRDSLTLSMQCFSSLYSGFFINLAVVPAYFSWIEYISPFAYLFKLLAINHWEDIGTM
jgi:hypothetical protein